MVGSLKILKMLHCRSLRSTVSEKPAKNRNDFNREERSSSGECLTNCDIKEAANKNKCRVCLRDGNIPIYGNTAGEDISKTLVTFAAIDVNKDDPYPKHLCQSCNALLQGGILFRKTAQYSDKILKEETQVNQSLLQPKKCPEMVNNYDDFEDINIETPYDTVEEKQVIKPTLMCKRCDIQFKSFEEYSDHRLSADHENKKLPCPICDKLYTPEYLKKHIILHTDEVSYMCDVCGKNFKMQCQFSRHRVTHFYNLPYKCSLCPYKGRFSESLKMHMRSHTGEKPYQCAHCPSRFISKSNLNKHVLTHTKKHAFKCDNNNCGKGFYTKWELEMHLKVDHTGVKEHKCRFCDKAFGYRKQMMKHERKVHKRAKLKSGRTPIYLRVENMKQQGKEVTLETK